MAWGSAERAHADDRDLRRPETLLAADALPTFLARMPAGSHVLDVGGQAGAAATGKSYRVSVAKLGPTLGGEGRLPDDVSVALDEAESSVQGVLAVTVFYFLPKPAGKRLIAEMHRVLAANGLAFAAFPPLWNPNLQSEALIDAATPDGPDADIVRRNGVSVRYMRYTTREIESLLPPRATSQLTTQKNGVRRLVFRKKS